MYKDIYKRKTQKMKKALIIVAVVTFSVSMVACKKDYNCTCTLDGQTEVLPLGKQKKKDAENACDVFDILAKEEGGSCSI